MKVKITSGTSFVFRNYLNFLCCSRTFIRSRSTHSIHTHILVQKRIVNNLDVEEVAHRHDAHVEADKIGNSEGNGTRWLRNDNHGIDEAVGEAGDGSDADQHGGESCSRVGQHVQEADEEEGNDVLQIVQVGTADTLHVRIVHLHLHLLGGQILWIRKCLEKSYDIGKY